MATQEEFHDRIRKHKVFLSETLCEEIDIILQYVEQEKLITKREYRNLKDVLNREKRTIDLLDKLMSKGEQTCSKFVELLRRDDIQETFPSLVDHPIIPPSGRVQDTSVDYPNQETSKIEHYKITQLPRGVCVIINNVHFADVQECTRMGSDEDQKSLERVFIWLGFDVVVHKDKTSAQMKDLLKDLGEKVSGDCFICCILSHGESIGVYGTDEVIVSVDEIREPFNGSNCKNLTGKPKLFFIQACRGGKTQKSVKVQADDPEGAESELEEDADSFEFSIPADSDFLIARSTIDGYVSYRNIWNGSRFIQSLCLQLEKLCPLGTDIQTILLRVNEEVSRYGINTKQMPIYEVALRKKLILHVPAADA